MHAARDTGSSLHGQAGPRTGAAGDGAIGKRTLTERLAAAPVQRRADGAAPDPAAIHAAAAHGTSGAAGPLPFRDTIQRAFGRHDVSQIAAHLDGAAQAGAAGMGAEAYATGDRVAFARAPSLHTAAHEAAHVVQQRAGVPLAGGIGAEGDAHERQADAVADRVVRGDSAEDLLPAAAPGSGGGGTAIQRKVKVNGDERDAESLSGLFEAESRELAVAGELVAAEPDYAFATEQELQVFVNDVAQTDWKAPPTSSEQSASSRVATFANDQVGKHVWASDHRQVGDLRVTRTDTLNQRFRRFRDLAQVPQGWHQAKSEKPELQTEKKYIEHVHSAMMTSLSPASPLEDRAQANTDVHDVLSVMNCEQFVAYTLWGGGVIKDWELALIFAGCAREDSMSWLYQAMGFGVAHAVELGGESLQLGATSTLFELNGSVKDIKKVAHMLVYAGGNVIELNASKTRPEDWRAGSTPESDYAKRERQNKCVYACPVASIPAQLQQTLRAIVDKYPGGQLLAPRKIAQPTEDHHKFGFLRYEAENL